MQHDERQQKLDLITSSRSPRCLRMIMATPLAFARSPLRWLPQRGGRFAAAIFPRRRESRSSSSFRHRSSSFAHHHHHHHHLRCINARCASNLTASPSPVRTTLRDRSCRQVPFRLGQRRAQHISTQLADYDLNDATCNVSPSIADKLGIQLHRQPNHPLQIITRTIHEYFLSLFPSEDVGGDGKGIGDASFPLFDDLSPIVTTQAAFDSLRIPVDHPSRSKTDTYYLNSSVVLRPHTSAHQVELLRGSTTPHQFLVAGDVYRRDEIDKSHYPVFHQMEGVQLFKHPNNDADQVHQHLKQTLEGLARHLFGSDVPMRWVDAYFPFTHPSMELEIYYDNDWMEVLGCGVIHPQILMNAGRIESLKDPSTTGWAFGLGLERLAMVLFNIPDIRLFWSRDDRFLSQFQSGQIVKFQPYSKFPPVYKDVSFWLPSSGDPTTVANGESAAAFHANDVYEVIRNVGGDWIEQVRLLDEFVHPRTGRVSHCYRVTWRSMDRSLTNDEIDALQETVRQQVSKELGAELR